MIIIGSYSHSRTFAVLAVCSGWLMGGLRADELKTEMTVMMPPFIVEQPVGPSWKYAKTSRFEILSRCNDATTEELAIAFSRSSQLLDLVLPPRFRLRLDVPQTLIFYDEKLWPVSEQNAVAQLLKTNPPARPITAPSENASRRAQLVPFVGIPEARPFPESISSTSFFSNLMLTDADSISIFALVSNRMIDPQKAYLTYGYVRTLLRGRTPALPDWFWKGFLRLYGKMDFNRESVTTKPPRSFLTAEESVGLKESLAFLFDAGAPSLADLGSWSIQSEMFVSWGIDPQNERVSAFWNFVDRACSEPVTESLFEECFGLDYVEAARQIDAYAASSRGIRWNAPEEILQFPTLLPQEASPNEIARIKGEWERLEARYVRKNHSEFESQYVNLARRTLGKAVERSDRDPRLLASLGLLELDAGDAATAVPLLEEATQHEVIRPRAYFELARLRYEYLDGRSRRNDGKYTKEQTDYMLKMLLAAARQSPPLRPVYDLIDFVSSNSIDPPGAEVAAALKEGARLFPGWESGTRSQKDSLLVPMEPPRIMVPISLE